MAESRSKKKEPNPVYRVLFAQQGRVYEVYVRGVYQSDLYGFIEVEEFLFGERGRTIVDTSEERLRAEFQDVGRVFLPIASVLRIDEVERRGTARITDGKNSDQSNITRLPLPSSLSKLPNRDGNN